MQGHECGLLFLPKGKWKQLRQTRHSYFKHPTLYFELTEFLRVPTEVLDEVIEEGLGGIIRFLSHVRNHRQIRVIDPKFGQEARHPEKVGSFVLESINGPIHSDRNFLPLN